MNKAIQLLNHFSNSQLMPDMWISKIVNRPDPVFTEEERLMLKDIKDQKDRITVAISTLAVTAENYISDALRVLPKNPKKIIGKSNFDDERVDDILIAENVPEKMGMAMVSFLNDNYSTNQSTYYYFLVDQDKELYHFEP